MYSFLPVLILLFIYPFQGFCHKICIVTSICGSPIILQVCTRKPKQKSCRCWIFFSLSHCVHELTYIRAGRHALHFYTSVADVQVWYIFQRLYFFIFFIYRWTSLIWFHLLACIFVQEEQSEGGGEGAFISSCMSWHELHSAFYFFAKTHWFIPVLAQATQCAFYYIAKTH